MVFLGDYTRNSSFLLCGNAKTIGPPAAAIGAATPSKEEDKMSAIPPTVLGNLADWELPSLEKRMGKLIEDLQKKKLWVALDADSLGEQLYAQLWDHVRELGATAANEAIAGWLQGVADGRPDLCIRFAYLDGEAEATPLTIVYSVGAVDGSRMELRRIDLEEVLLEEAQFDHDSDAELEHRRQHAKTMVAHLRKLADTVDKELDAFGTPGGPGSPRAMRP
jgi:hypothetical protein